MSLFSSFPGTFYCSSAFAKGRASPYSSFTTSSCPPYSGSFENICASPPTCCQHLVQGYYPPLTWQLCLVLTGLMASTSLGLMLSFISCNHFLIHVFIQHWLKPCHGICNYGVSPQHLLDQIPMPWPGLQTFCQPSSSRSSPAQASSLPTRSGHVLPVFPVFTC